MLVLCVFYHLRQAGVSIGPPYAGVFYHLTELRPQALDELPVKECFIWGLIRARIRIWFRHPAVVVQHYHKAVQVVSRGLVRTLRASPY